MKIQFRKILCPVDFYPASTRALEYAEQLARNYNAAIQLIHVVTPVIPAVYGSGISISDLTVEFQKQARKKILEVKAKVEKKHIPVTAEVRVGHIDIEIRRAIEAGKADLVVVGTHGRRGVERWVLGSVTEKLMRHCPVPLLAVPAGRKAAAPISRMVVTTDFSDGTPDAIAHAFSIASENRSKVTLLHVINDVAADINSHLRDPLIRGIRQKLEELVPRDALDWCDIQTRVETGTPWSVILETIKKEKSSLLVMNVHGKGMIERVLIGSTADRVLRGATCPVLLIPPMKMTPTGKAKKR